MAFVVVAPVVAVSVPIGARSSQVRFVEQGAPLPEGVAPAAVQHLLDMGMVESSPVAEPDVEPDVEPARAAKRR